MKEQIDKLNKFNESTHRKIETIKLMALVVICLSILMASLFIKLHNK
jgi:hypothetical protein